MKRQDPELRSPSVVVGVGLERGIQLGELGVVDAALPADLAGRAEGDDAALRGAQPQGGDRGRQGGATSAGTTPARQRW
jgi:hypothetical protein